jgi:hypothetical protein
MEVYRIILKVKKDMVEREIMVWEAVEKPSYYAVKYDGVNRRIKKSDFEVIKATEPSLSIFCYMWTTDKSKTTDMEIARKMNTACQFKVQSIRDKAKSLVSQAKMFQDTLLEDINDTYNKDGNYEMYS